MAYHLFVKEEASREIIKAYRWYEIQQKGVGEIFKIFLEKCFNQILLNPKTFPKKHKEMRQALVSRFPFAVIYEIERENIFVYAVFHTSRNPSAKFRKV